MRTAFMTAARIFTYDRTLRVLCCIALAAAGFILPAMPSLGLDSAWQMALGRFFADGRQFGTEIVFTYGPLGWTMGNMYWGELWGALVAWHAAFAVVTAVLVTWSAFQLPPIRRTLFLIFFLFLGMRHEDILQQIAIAMAGFELIRRADQPWRRSSTVFAALLAVLSLVKFTNLVLATAMVLLAIARPMAQRDWRGALPLPAWFAGLFFAGWLLCGQNPANLPSYLINSWAISSGYQDAMGWSCPSLQLYHGLAVAALLVGYLVTNALADSNRWRGLTLGLAATAYLFLSWKHGFIRADGHQLIFYLAALTLALGSPHLLGDARRWYWPRQILLLAAAILAMRGADLATPGFARGALTGLADRLQRHVELVRQPGLVRSKYDWTLDSLRAEVPLPLTRQVIGNRTVDILGFEQDVMLLNRFNYAPRPVFQSYSAYTPRLARLNRAYFASAHAPEFVLSKLQTVDGRLETMDDSLALDLLPQAYRYLFTERGISLWQRRSPPPGPPVAPVPLRTVTARLGETIDIADLRDHQVWVSIDYRLNWIGRLRRLLFKPPVVQLHIADEAGNLASHRLPGPIGATGFLLSPLIRDGADFLRAINGDNGRPVTALTIAPAPRDFDCFHEHITVTLSSRPVATGSGWAALPLGSPDLPLAFARGQAPFGAQLSQVEGELEYYAHAPSSLVYRPATGATLVRGSFGFYAGAYAPENGSPSDGAEFLVRWHSADGRQTILFRRLLQPHAHPADRGLQTFTVALPAPADGEIEFEITPGPNGNSASDWTFWRGLHLEK